MSVPAAISRRPRRWLLRALGLGLVLGLGAVLTCVAWTRLGARGHLYPAEDVPAAPVALVLGAEVYPDGSPSPFLAARLALAKRLYDERKVRALLVSGDHRQFEYDEPGAMRRWLVAHGVPERRVVLDHAGLDTYDSCVRAHRIFGVDRLIVVTQTFHLPRAVAICRAVGVAADGVGDDSTRVYRQVWLRNSMREYAAAVKATLDVASRRDPVLLGPRETGVQDALRQ